MPVIDKETKRKFFKRICKAICKCKNFTKCNCKTTKILNSIDVTMSTEKNKAGQDVLFYEQKYTKKVSVKIKDRPLEIVIEELIEKTIAKLKEVKIYRFDLEEK
ncbi:hypothetical protein MYMA111404_03360 [Mycoplasma marinum]|uniref:Uncharacterized protein n=1 Tax=Mycoplasma marinum TaxID=1937190 RepID=A0A4R0XNJ3_9MOLU|nr:hypothetical protein [Mycoplasma marinum]TCG11062.1 hypothetical protein C4B24_03190 [Mycoplasma marinum]